MNGEQKKKWRKRRKFRGKSAKSAIGEQTSAEMVLIDEIHSSTTEEGENIENIDEEIIFVCTSTATASTDESSDETQQGQKEVMELVDEIHSSPAGEEENIDEEIIFVCTSTASSSTNEADKQKEEKEEEKISLTENCEIKCEEAETETTTAAEGEDAAGQSDATTKGFYLPLTKKYLPAFPMLNSGFSDDDDEEEEEEEGEADEPTEAQQLAAEFARQNMNTSERAKALLQLISGFSTDSLPAEEKNDDDEIEYIGAVQK